MKKIFKYELKITDRQIITMPHKSKVLSVAVQNGIPVLYAMVEPRLAITENHTIEIIGTGNPIGDDSTPRTFIGTFQIGMGAPHNLFVGHVFELEII